MTKKVIKEEVKEEVKAEEVITEEPEKEVAISIEEDCEGFNEEEE